MTEFTREIVLAAVKRTLEEAAMTCREMRRTLNKEERPMSASGASECDVAIRAIDPDAIVATIEQEAIQP